MHSFYWGNVVHDRLWDLGFGGTIAYGYVPYDIPWDWYGGFHRPDPVYIITRDESVNYDSDGDPYYTDSPHVHYEYRNGTSPAIHMTKISDIAGGYRDMALSSEALIHEYQHLVTLRLIAAANGGESADHWVDFNYTGQLALHGAFEGISDFVALSLLSNPYQDNPNGEYGGCYAYGAFAAAGRDIWDQCSYAPYYFGVRRLPYSTDRTKNPLTIDDLVQDNFDVGSAPYNSYHHSDLFFATEPHNAGEIFGSMLWDLRAKLIQKIGEDGSDTAVKLLNLATRHFSPYSDDWADLRDAILLADTTYFGGRFRQEIWEAFAGRGLGEDAQCRLFIMTESVHWAVITEDYTIAPDPGLSSQVTAPVFQPLGGWYESAPSVQITCDTPGATIRYTTDGSDPDTNSPVYNSTPIPVNATTVLKAKAWYGAEPPSRIRENLFTIYTAIPWERHDNEQVSFRGKVTAIFPQGSEKWIYIQHPDRIWGIRVVADSSVVAFPGWVMDVEGETRTDLENGERYVLADSGYPVRYGTEYGPVAPLGMRNQWLGGDGGAFTPSINEAFGYYNVGLLVHTWGKVTYRNVNEGVFGIDDGTMLIEPLGVGCGSGRGVRVKLPAGMEMPALGTYLRVRGISSVAKAYPNGQGSYYVRQLLPRSYLDITEETSWHTMNIALDPDEWLYFSLPGIPKQPEPYHVMNRYPANTILWRSNNLYRWDARLDYWQSYVDGCGSELFGNFLVGDGYKFFHSNPYYPGYEYADGFTFEHADVTGDQFISLPNGSQSLPTTDSHSLIGNPFPTAKSWATMTVTDGNSIKFLPQAVTDGWIHSVKVWNGTTLQDVDVSTGSMEILKAYEIYPKYDNMALIIPE